MKTVQAAILVVDDNEHNRDMLARRIQRQGHAVMLAEDGREALELVHKHRFDLILLDIMMPDLNGYQVLEQLKATPALSHIPVVMISAIDDIDSVVRCIELGAEDYLFKPFNPVLLRARINASLEKKRLRDQERAYLVAVRREMELGRRIQAGFLPESLPQPPGWEIAAAFQPASEVAGDFYDAFELADGRLGLVIADVCDKGVGAALFMALIRSLIRTYAEQAASTSDEPLLAVALTNSYIARHHHRARTNMFATLFFGVLEPATGTLEYVNAGHLPPLLVGPNGVRQLLEVTGPAMGLAAESTYGLEQVVLAPGELWVSYTDGLTEARAPDGTFFSEERLHALLPEPASSETLLARIEAARSAHIADGPSNDDVTLLVARRF